MALEISGSNFNLSCTFIAMGIQAAKGEIQLGNETICPYNNLQLACGLLVRAEVTTVVDSGRTVVHRYFNSLGLDAKAISCPGDSDSTTCSPSCN